MQKSDVGTNPVVGLKIDYPIRTSVYHGCQLVQRNAMHPLGMESLRLVGLILTQWNYEV
jgi:hypothetical protein